jgi:hypothetical protein
VPTRILAPDEARAVVPELDVSGVVCASYNPHDGILFPWPFLWGYAAEAARRGVEIHPHTDVTQIERQGDGSFPTYNTAPARGQATTVAAGDFDGDGHLDLATSNFHDPSCSVMLGRGDATFRPTVNYPAGTLPRFVLAADLDADGKSDLVLADFNYNQLIVLHNIRH